MFVFADSRKQAEERTTLYLDHAGWEKVVVLVALERQGPPPDWDERLVKAYRQAELYGVGFHVGLLPVGGANTPRPA